MRILANLLGVFIVLFFSTPPALLKTLGFDSAFATLFGQQEHAREAGPLKFYARSIIPPLLV